MIKDMDYLYMLQVLESFSETLNRAVMGATAWIKCMQVILTVSSSVMMFIFVELRRRHKAVSIMM